MDEVFEELCYACRTGDVENVDRLISYGVNLHQVDKFDNSPLFLASLCGHEEVVKLLLQRGAVCDRDRYEGARCIYGALTDSIRDILLSYDISKAVDVNQPFAAHISSLFTETDSFSTKDLFSVAPDGTRLSAHAFMLLSRSEAFYNLLLRLNESQYNDFNSGGGGEFAGDILNLLMRYVYLVPVLHEIKPSQFSALIKLAKLTNFPLLAEFLDRASHTTDPTKKSSLMIDYQYKLTELARDQLKVFVDAYVINSSVTLNVEDCTEGIEREIEIELSNDTLTRSFPDVMLLVRNGEGAIRLYPCHLAMLIRADYFKSFLSTSFREAVGYVQRGKSPSLIGDRNKYLVISLPACDFQVAEVMIRYLYYDMSDIPPDHAADIIKLGDFILDERLKRIAAAVIAQSYNVTDFHTVFEMLYLGWRTNVERLEQYAAKYIANNLGKLESLDELKTAILRSSQRISKREETDTIELVADIRFYLLEKYCLEFDDLTLLNESDDREFLKDVGLLDYKNDMDIIEGICRDLNLDI